MNSAPKFPKRSDGAFLHHTDLLDLLQVQLSPPIWKLGVKAL